MKDLHHMYSFKETNTNNTKSLTALIALITNNPNPYHHLTTTTHHHPNQWWSPRIGNRASRRPRAMKPEIGAYEEKDAVFLPPISRLRDGPPVADKAESLPRTNCREPDLQNGAGRAVIPPACRRRCPSRGNELQWLCWLAGMTTYRRARQQCGVAARCWCIGAGINPSGSDCYLGTHLLH